MRKTGGRSRCDPRKSSEMKLSDNPKDLLLDIYTSTIEYDIGDSQRVKVPSSVSHGSLSSFILKTQKWSNTKVVEVEIYLTI